MVFSHTVLIYTLCFILYGLKLTWFNFLYLGFNSLA